MSETTASGDVDFVCSIADSDNAIRYSGNGNGQRVLIDIPEVEIGNAAGLLALRGKRLKVTIRPLTEDEERGLKPPKSTKIHI